MHYAIFLLAFSLGFLRGILLIYLIFRLKITNNELSEGICIITIPIIPIEPPIIAIEIFKGKIIGWPIR